MINALPFKTGGHLSLSKNPFGLFRQFFAVCCAHSLCAFGAQLAHLQPEKCFRPRTEGELPGTGKRGHPGVRRGRKRFRLYSPQLRRTLRGFFDSLKRKQIFCFLFSVFMLFSLWYFIDFFPDGAIILKYLSGMVLLWSSFLKELLWVWAVLRRV